ncbi:hypothetical protein Z949_2451 [Sulfitobacter guttiformis KCTC 32187]|nr:hypothetical protein Z949_2451 [Sulfitobacter guttiformis KCTC 32187]
MFQLKARRKELQLARFSGLLTVAFGEDTVTYKSDAQMAAALAAIEVEISKLTRGPRPRTTYPQTSKGLI